MDTTGKKGSPLRRKERTEKQKRRRLAAALAVIAAALLTLAIPRPSGRGTAAEDGRAEAEGQMDACLDSLLEALGHPVHTVTATGPAEKHETGWKEFRLERIRQLEIAAGALTAAGDTAGAREARRLAARLEEAEEGEDRKAWARWVEWKDRTGRTHTLMQEMHDGRCRAVSTEKIH